MMWARLMHEQDACAIMHTHFFGRLRDRFFCAVPPPDCRLGGAKMMCGTPSRAHQRQEQVGTSTGSFIDAQGVLILHANP